MTWKSSPSSGGAAKQGGQILVNAWRRVRDISHKEYIPSSTLALPWIKLSVLEENSDIRKCGQWLDSQPFGIFYKAEKTVSYPMSNGTKI
jgi:hypothetical protein